MRTERVVSMLTEPLAISSRSSAAVTTNRARSSWPRSTTISSQRSTSAGEMSEKITVPSGPTRSSASSPISPSPAPTSSSIAPSMGPALASTRSRIGPRCSSTVVRCRASPACRRSSSHRDQWSDPVATGHSIAARSTVPRAGRGVEQQERQRRGPSGDRAAGGEVDDPERRGPPVGAHAADVGAALEDLLHPRRVAFLDPEPLGAVEAVGGEPRRCAGGEEEVFRYVDFGCGAIDRPEPPALRVDQCEAGGPDTGLLLVGADDGEGFAAEPDGRSGGPARPFRVRVRREPVAQPAEEGDGARERVVGDLEARQIELGEEAFADDEHAAPAWVDRESGLLDPVAHCVARLDAGEDPLDVRGPDGASVVEDRQLHWADLLRGGEEQDELVRSPRGAEHRAGQRAAGDHPVAGGGDDEQVLALVAADLLQRKDAVGCLPGEEADPSTEDRNLRVDTHPRHVDDAYRAHHARLVPRHREQRPVGRVAPRRHAPARAAAGPRSTAFRADRHARAGSGTQAVGIHADELCRLAFGDHAEERRGWGGVPEGDRGPGGPFGAGGGPRAPRPRPP